MNEMAYRTMYSPSTQAEKDRGVPWQHRSCMRQVQVRRIAPKPKRVRYLPDADGKLRRTVVAT